MVQFTDGSIKAQLGLPDMKLPIQYAMAWPERIENDFPRMDFGLYPELTFEQANTEVFPNLRLAREAMIHGGNMPCMINAANEVLVQAFLQNRISFNHIPLLIEQAMHEDSFIAKPSLEDYFESDKETRIKTLERIKNI